MSTNTGDLPLYDRTARKAHQWTMVGLVVAGLILGGIPGIVLLAVAGGIMLAGRFWWPADVVRQLTWRGLEPARGPHGGRWAGGPRTRRLSRIIGGVRLLVPGPPLPPHPGLGLGVQNPI